jgi:hypothetical protein
MATLAFSATSIPIRWRWSHTRGCFVFRTVVSEVDDLLRLTAGHAARSLRSWPFAGDGFGFRSIVHEGGYGSRPSAGPAAREALREN